MFVCLSLLIVGAATVADVPLADPEHHGGYFSFAFSADGHLVAGGTGALPSGRGEKRVVRGGEVVLWDAATGDLVGTLGSHGDNVDWVEFARDGKLLFSGSRLNGLVQAWSLDGAESNVGLRPGTPYSKNVSPCVSADGRTVAFVAETVTKVGKKRVVRASPMSVFDVRRGTVRWKLQGPDVRALAVDPRGRWLAVSLKQSWKNNGKTRLVGRSAKQSIELRELLTGRTIRTIENTWGIDALQVHPDGRSLVGVSRTEVIRWSTADGAELERFSIKGENSPRRIAISKSGDLLALSRFMGKKIEVWDLRTKKVCHVMDSASEALWFPNFSPSLTRLACKKGPRACVLPLLERR